MNHLPNLQFEKEYWERGFLVAGIDEVGRGSFAGPLVAASVVIKPIINSKILKKLLGLGINDSKLVSSKTREVIADVAQEYILFSSLRYIPVSTINLKGVGFANRHGFHLVAKDTLLRFGDDKIFFLTDAFKIPRIKKSNQKNIVRGDSTSISIALASILAKVERDRYMKRAAKEYQNYGFDRNKGYGTLFHRDRIKIYGPTPLHRKVFIKNCV